MFKKSNKVFAVFAALLTLMLAAVTNQAHARTNNSTIVSPHETFLGKTYGEWEASWWQKFLAIPVVNGDHPYFSGGDFKAEKGVRYLATGGGKPFTIPVKIRAGTALFVPIINAECSVIEQAPWHGDDETSLRACANGHIDQTSGRSAELDGKPVKSLDKYRVESPLFQFGPLPQDNLLGVPEGTTSNSVDAGYYLLIRPLSVGKHTLRIKATWDEFSSSIDTTFIITVVSKTR